MLENFKLILGSGSPRRKQLLEGIGLQPEVRLKDVDESFPPELTRSSIALYLAEHKAKAYQQELSSSELLITADTIVCCDAELLGKPVSKEDAIRMLTRLQGRDHQVFTGVCICTSASSISFVEESIVQFHSLTMSDILNYVEHYQPFDKAGSYGAQECLAPGINPCSEEELQFLKEIGHSDLFEKSLAVNNLVSVPIISRITGSYFNVMGLPILTLWKRLVEIDAEYKGR
ncbi:MAG: Maf family protein [Bacteroidia bacterium]